MMTMLTANLAFLFSVLAVSQADSPARVPSPSSDSTVVAAPPATPAPSGQRSDALIQSAYKRLQQNDPRGALLLFDQALRETPDSAEARQGKAKALIQLGDREGELGHWRAQHHDYRLALESDPRLGDDPNFARKYQMSAHAGPPPQPYPSQPAPPYDESESPRLPPPGYDYPPGYPPYGYGPPGYPPSRQVYRFVHDLRAPREDHWFGFNLSSGLETIFGVGLTGLLFQHVMLTADVDLIYPALDVDAKGLFLKSAWSPYIGVGGHFGFNRLPPPNYLWQRNFLHFEAGAQYFSRIGMYFNIGLTWVPPIVSGIYDKTALSYPFPHIQLGWMLDSKRY